MPARAPQQAARPQIAHAPHAAKPSVKLPLTYSQIPGSGDIKVLNYALALEQLEADLYLQASERLTTGGTNALGKQIPGLGIGSDQADVILVQEFGVVEQQHRNFLKSALGTNAITPFKYNFGMEKLSRQEVLDLVLLAEETGVAAYLGAAGMIASRSYVSIAAAILGTEARHAAVISELVDELFDEGIAVAPLPDDNGGKDSPLTPDSVLASVSPFIVVS